MRCPAEKVTLDQSDKATGFTFIEVLIAVVVFSIGILALTGLQATTIGANSAARLQTDATAIGAGLVEHLRSLPYDHDDLAPTANPHRLPDDTSRFFSVHWIVKADTPVTGTKLVQVTVTPLNRTNGRRVTLSTIIAD
jgi:prepilin-type N-terminal cleavage/methylation domain-containing protein